MSASANLKKCLGLNYETLNRWMTMMVMDGGNGDYGDDDFDDGGDDDGDDYDGVGYVDGDGGDDDVAYGELVMMMVDW